MKGFTWQEIEKKDMDIERLDALAFERLQIIAEQAQQIATLMPENEKLKGEAMAWEKAFNIEWERLERLTTLINDDERANEVATEHGEMPSATSTLNGQLPDVSGADQQHPRLNVDKDTSRPTIAVR